MNKHMVDAQFKKVPSKKQTAMQAESLPPVAVENTEQTLKVLIIEDNHVDKYYIRGLLYEDSEQVYMQDFVETLDEATERLANQQYDVILIDYNLPDGTATDYIRTMKETIRAPFIVLTGHKDSYVEQKVLASGASDFIPKDELTARLLSRVIKFALERSKTYFQLKEQTIRDPLTDLYNRMGMEKLLENLLSGKNSASSFALLLIDVDKFKAINDTYGHATGDSILKIVAETLKSSTRSTRNVDHAVRIGGDEFALIATELNEMDSVHYIINRLMQKLARTFEVDGYEISVSLSIGVAIYPEDGDTLKELMSNADFSLYRAKKKTGTAFEFFDKGMHKKAQKKYFIENSLTKAINQKQFFLYYQPKYYTKDQSLNGFEALVRWNHPEKGIIWPREFIHISEETGHILQIGEWVLREACTQCAKWQEMTTKPLTVAVNVSVRQLLHTSFPEIVKQALEDSGLPPESLELEITESLVIQNLNQSNRILKQLRKMNIAISLDDFGTGYSSLARLRSLPINKLKMDRSLIRKVGKSHFDTAIARTVLSLAKNLKIAAIAEGVETEEQFRFLKNANCPEVQGYYFSKPVAPVEIEKIINE